MIILAISSLAGACDYSLNDKPLIQQQPQLIKTVQNGQLYSLANLSDTLLIARVKGSAYEMGFAYGQLFGAKLKEQLDIFYQYLESELQNAINIPSYFKKPLGATAKSLLKKVLTLNVLITRKYTNRRIFEETRGIAKATGINHQEILNINIFPQLIKAACTVLGVWGPATKNNMTLHMRALDWDKNFPINKYTLITVYHPSEEGSKKHANIGYLGLIGVLTGISEKVTIGQKVWIPPKSSTPATRFGQPWTYVLRDVIQFADNLSDANRILRKAKRTCTIHLGIASKDERAFDMVLYSQKNISVFDDKNYTHYGKNHPKLPGVAYWDKHVQPSGNQCVGQYITSRYGSWDAETLWRVVGASHQTGDTQLVVFELQTLTGWISYSQHGTGVQAYRRSPIKVQFRKLFESF